MTQFAIIGLVLAMIAVVAVLGMGLFTMLSGKDISGQKSNKLMWMRVFWQGVALAFFALVMVLVKKQGQ